MPKKFIKYGRKRTSYASRSRTSRSTKFAKTSRKIWNGVGKQDRIASQGLLQQHTIKPYVDRGPFPPEYHTKLRYSERVTLSSAAVTGLGGLEAVFRLGSLFDPNASGVGHQPYYFDQISPLYHKYQVYGCTVQIEYTNSPDNNLVVMYMIANGAAITDLLNLNSYDANERPGCGTIRYSAANATTTAYLGYQDLAKIEGKTRAEYMAADELYAAFTGANPTLSPLLRINCASDSLVADQSCYVTVTLVFHCKFFNRRMHGQS